MTTEILSSCNNEIQTYLIELVRFQVLTAASMKMTAFWNTAPCSLVEVDRRFRGAYCLHQGTSETFVYFNETTRSCIPESCPFNLASVFVVNTLKYLLYPTPKGLQNSRYIPIYLSRLYQIRAYSETLHTVWSLLVVLSLTVLITAHF
jgi:hypothetical protein